MNTNSNDNGVVSPKDAMKANPVPVEMLRAISDLVQSKLNQGVARFVQSELHQAVTRAGVSYADIQNHGWYDIFPDAFIDGGWIVEVYPSDHKDYPEKTYIFRTR